MDKIGLINKIRNVAIEKSIDLSFLSLEQQKISDLKKILKVFELSEKELLKKIDKLSKYMPVIAEDIKGKYKHNGWIRVCFLM